ncbi:hypothetical protein D3C86_1388900 [compost metagenome]
MRHCQIGLAGAGGTDAENQLGLFQRPHIDILRRRAGSDGLLAGGNLRHGNLRLALHRRQGQLVVCGHGHADRAFHVGNFGGAALKQALVEEIQRAAGLVGSDHIAGDGNGIAARARIDIEALFQQFQVLIELTE